MSARHFTVHTTYIPCAELEATVDFYRTLLQRDGVRVGRCEYAFDLGGMRLSCVRVGGHEHTPQAVALVLSTDRLPTTVDIKQAGGGRLDSFPFAVTAPEAMLATDPSGNAVCFVREASRT